MKTSTQSLMRVVAVAAWLGVVFGNTLPTTARPLNFAATPYEVWNVATQGNHQQGEDVTKTFQRRLDTQRQHGLPVYLPHGWWTISETVTTPYNTGCIIQAAGAADPVTKPHLELGHPLRGVGTRLVWAGEPGGTMLHATGVNLEIRGGLSISGKPYKTNEPQAGIGLLISRGERKGIGTGRMRFDALQFDDLDVGIQCGVNWGDPNNENNHFSTLRFRRCGIGYLSKNVMGMTTYVQMLYGGGTPRMLVYEAGGALKVENAVVANTTLLTVRESPDKGQTGVGKANGYFCFENLKVDAGSKGDFTALDVETPTQVHVVINGGILSYAYFARDGGVFAKLKGRSALTVRDFRGALGVIEGEAHRYIQKNTTPNVLLDRCQLWGTPDFKGPIDVRMRDCFDGLGNFLEDRSAINGQLTAND